MVQGMIGTPQVRMGGCLAPSECRGGAPREFGTDPGPRKKWRRPRSQRGRLSRQSKGSLLGLPFKSSYDRLSEGFARASDLLIRKKPPGAGPLPECPSSTGAARTAFCIPCPSRVCMGEAALRPQAGGTCTLCAHGFVMWEGPDIDPCLRLRSRLLWRAFGG